VVVGVVSPVVAALPALHFLDHQGLRSGNLGYC
jgi:hypothetical protein